jgi:hypothetical protein
VPLHNETKTNNYFNMADAEPSVPAALAADAPLQQTTKQKIDPYSVAGEVGADGVTKAINYLSLIEEFGTKKILEEDLARFEKVTGHKPHRFMRRGIVFSHRDLNLILDRHEKGEPFFLYTGEYEVPSPVRSSTLYLSFPEGFCLQCEDSAFALYTELSTDSV